MKILISLDCKDTTKQKKCCLEQTKTHSLNFVKLKLYIKIILYIARSFITNIQYYEQ